MPLHSELSPTSRQVEEKDYSGENDAQIRFRKYTLYPARRLLRRERCAVAIGDRAFDLLQLLLDKRGTVVSKNEITKFVWPSTTVSESNLRFQITSLRKALGEDRDLIRTVTGRGYLLTPDIGSSDSGETPPTELETLLPAYGVISEAYCHARAFAPHNDWSRPSVIVVDDEGGVCEGLRGFLQSAGVRVQLFGTVNEFLAKIQVGAIS